MTATRLRAAKATLAVACLVAALPLISAARRQGGDPLPSWNEVASKKAIVAFVGRVTREGGPDFVPVPARIAVFDNDGTLWSEQPIYFQVAFAFDRVKALAPAASRVEGHTAVQGRARRRHARPSPPAARRASWRSWP